VAERRLAFQLASVGSVPPQESLRGAVDPDPVVRLAAARAIDVTEQHGRAAIRVLTDDTDPAVAAAAAARTLAVEDSEEARDRLDLLLADRSPRVRRAALEQLRLAPSEIAADLAAGLLEDPAPEVRTAALTAMRGVPDRALEPAVAALDDPDPWVRAEAGRVLGVLGPAAVGSVLAALDRPKTMAAGVEAARLLRAGDRSDLVDDFVVACGERIGRDVTLAGSIPNGDEARDFLRAAVLERAQRVARSALWAATTVARQPDAMAVAIEHLDADASRVPAALETLETASGRTAVRPLLAPWETIPTHTAPDWLAHALADDATIHRCAAFIRDMQGGDTMVRSATGTAIERALLLRHVPLFAELNPTDLELVAEVAEERGYADAETIALQGEIGDEIHIITEGTIRVMQAHEGEERELATRAEGDVVGEMSLLTRTPRVATLVADGSVRTLTIGYRQFESILRERPTVSLGLLRVLASRLSDAADAPERTA
jgi:HEAT repeat protein